MAPIDPLFDTLAFIGFALLGAVDLALILFLAGCCLTLWLNRRS